MSPTSAPATPVVLNAHFAVHAMRDLLVHAELGNRAPHDIFVCNQLWTLEGGSRPVSDPERVYRFVQGGTLRLLLGPCPLPRRYTVLFRNLPHVTRLRPGGSLPIELALSGPICEYSVYFPKTSKSTEERVAVKEVELFVYFLADRPELEVGDSWLGPPALELRSAAASQWFEFVRVRSPRLELDVWKRSDEFDRLYLPGEPLPPL